MSSIVDVRNSIAQGLASYLNIPVLLHDQIGPEQPEPFCVYSVTAAYIPISSFGDHQIAADDDDAKDTRTEQAHATLSLTFCSLNRWDGDTYVLGDDEAQGLAELARGWLLHAGYMFLARRGIVVVDVMNAANRTTIEINEAARRYGFDVRVRYTIQDVRVDPTIERAVFDSVYTRQEDD